MSEEGRYGVYKTTDGNKGELVIRVRFLDLAEHILSVLRRRHHKDTFEIFINHED